MANSVVEKLFQDNWPIRRRWLRLALIWMALNVQIILIVGFFKIEIMTSALHQNALISMLTAIVSMIGFYVFGAVWDDSNKRSRMRPQFVEDTTETIVDPPCPEGETR